jgi:DNA-binding CsgD family transcriptional regulator
VTFAAATTPPWSPTSKRASRASSSRRRSSAVTDTPATLLNTDGSRVDVEISSVPLRSGGLVIGVFGQFADVPDDPPTEEIPGLTPRQHEVLRLLQRGHSTEQIAAELNISRDTVRNHVADLLRALGAKSRLEAVALSFGR